MRRVAPKSSVQSIERALKIMRFLSGKPGGVPLTYIGENLGINSSTVHRILSTLMAAGFVVQDPDTDRYRLGFAIVEMSSAILSALDIRREAAKSLESLAFKSLEVVHLGILNEGAVTYVGKKDAGNRLEMFSAIGRRAPLHCTGLGKAILAFLPDHVIKKIIGVKGLRKYTKNTITEMDRLQREMGLIRARRYAIDNEEHEVGIRCVAAPIFNHQGDVIASISIAGPSGRMTDDRIKELLPDLLRESDVISGQMGFATCVI